MGNSTDFVVNRAIHGVEIFGGQERVTMCVDQVMPQSVMNLIGFSKCSKLIAEEMAAEQARQDALLASGNYTYAPPAPGVGEGAEVEVSLFGYFWLFLVFLAISVWAIRLTRVFCSTLQDLILTETDAADAGSSAGRVIVGGSVLWMTIAGYFALNAARWLCARCYEHYLRARLFAACTDPQEAALFDVP